METLSDPLGEFLAVSRQKGAIVLGGSTSESPTASMMFVLKKNENLKNNSGRSDENQNAPISDSANS